MRGDTTRRRDRIQEAAQGRTARKQPHDLDRQLRGPARRPAALPDRDPALHQSARARVLQGGADRQQSPLIRHWQQPEALWRHIAAA